jgi:hypothetical protein
MGLADAVMMVPLAGGAPTMLVSGTTTPSFTGASKHNGS